MVLKSCYVFSPSIGKGKGKRGQRIILFTCNKGEETEKKNVEELIDSI